MRQPLLGYKASRTVGQKNDRWENRLNETKYFPPRGILSDFALCTQFLWLLQFEISSVKISRVVPELILLGHGTLALYGAIDTIRAQFDHWILIKLIEIKHENANDFRIVFKKTQRLTHLFKWHPKTLLDTADFVHTSLEKGSLDNRFPQSWSAEVCMIYTRETACRGTVCCIKDLADEKLEGRIHPWELQMFWMQRMKPTAPILKRMATKLKFVTLVALEVWRMNFVK